MKLLLPKNEARRLDELRGYEILDTAPENSYERIVRMTARQFDVPMAAVSLVDEYRQWCKASCGVERGETAREVSFCAHAILQKQVFVVPDARQDARFADNPLVAGEPGVRFYAGAPLCTAEGYLLGALCVMDTRPHRFTPEDEDALIDLAAVVVDELTLRKVASRLRREIEEKKSAQRALKRQHRLLQRLSGTQEAAIRQRTAKLSRSNQSLRAEIARREQTERDGANLTRLIEASPDFIALATLDTVPTFINEAGLRLVGLDGMAEARELRLSDFFLPEDRSFVVETAMRNVREHGRFESDFRFRHFRTGAALPVCWNVFLVRDPRSGEPVGVAMTARDIAGRKRAEAALHLAKDEAEKANAAKSEFLSRMSHELRTPLNAILGFGQILQKGLGVEAQRDCANHVVTAGRHLLSLINEVLDIARIEAGHVELALESVRVADAVAETLDLIRPLAAERRIAVEMSPETPGAECVLADRQRFKQVMLNLLSNAVKYSPEGGRVLIEYRADRPRTVRLCVTDHGPGIAAGDAARLFVPFDRLGAEHSQVQGTGLGLALSRRLVEAMDGEIGVRTAPGEGSTFWVRLPRGRTRRAGDGNKGAIPPPPSVREDEPGMVEPAPNPALYAACTVLYVEDRLANLHLLEHILAPCPQIRLLSARSGEEAVALARRQPPDLILLDLHGSGVRGREVLARMRAEKATRPIPVIALSADATAGTVERLTAAGVRAHLTKPLDIDSLYRILPRASRAARRRLTPRLVPTP